MNLYRKASEKYRSDKIKVLFIAESPPAKNKKGELRYFYFDRDDKGEKLKGKNQGLYTNMMKVIFEKEFNDSEPKEVFLESFKGRGFFLIDAVKFPINKGYNKSDRKKLIEKYSKDIGKEIGNLKPEKTIVICKAVYNILVRNDIIDGNVPSVPFPSRYNVKRFHKSLKEILKEV
jgi:hypothetical protein